MLKFVNGFLRKNMSTNIELVFIGAMNIDIIAPGLNNFANPGEQVNGNELFMTSGGKASNMARMASNLLGRNKVVLVAKSVKDKFNLYKIPLDILRKSGIITNYLVMADQRSDSLPTIAIILGKENAENSVYYFPGCNEDLKTDELSSIDPLLKLLSLKNGFMVITGEVPVKTTEYLLDLAESYNLQVMLDPGGTNDFVGYRQLLQKHIYLLKPNAQEASLLSGVKVSSFASAKLASDILLMGNLEHLLITHGSNGAYYFHKQLSKHFPNPLKGRLAIETTGCGDQVLATLAACLIKRKNLLNSIELAIMSGSVQSQRMGATPVSWNEIL